MLPSTGYFKAINCPFYENGYCERPYCHFRHSRRDGASTSTVVTSETSQALSKSQNASAAVTAANSDVIQHLVSEAVKKVLADQNVTDTENIVNKVVAGLKPTLPAVLSTTASVVKPDIVAPDPIIGKHTSVPVLPTVKPSSCTYNPTPIAELKKRHIPITAYEPTRESKAVKRKSPDAERPWMDVIRNISGLKESKISYTPTAIGQTSSTEKKNSRHSYIPTIKSDNSLNLYDINSSSKHSYIPGREKRKKKKEVYHPKPKKRREEYVPRKPKIPLKSKPTLDDEYNVFDDILGGSESNPSVIIDEESRDVIEVESKGSDDDDVIAITNITKDDDEVEILVSKISQQDEKENEEAKKKNETNNEYENKNLDRSNKEKSDRQEESAKYSKEDSSKSKSKSSEKSNKEDSKHSKHREDSKHSKSKDEDSKHCKSKEDDTKHSKNKEDDLKHRSKEDSKHSKSKDKDRGEEKKDKDKDKEKSKEKDKHKSSSRSNDKEHSSSSSKDKNKEKDKEKDKDKIKDSRGNSKDNSHRSKKDSKSDKEKSSGSRDSKDSKKDSKEKSSHKSDDKSKHKSKSSSSDLRSKSSKQSHKSSDKPGSHSSHKSSKSNDKRTETEDEVSDRTEDKSDQDEKFDGPEYEQFSPFYDEQLLETDDSDHDVEEECRKIFQEYEVSDHPKDVTSKAPPKPEAEDHEEISKKRVAHPSAVSSMTKQVGPAQPPKRLINPQQKMYDRWRMMREAAAAQAAERAAAAQAAERAAAAQAAENAAAAKAAENAAAKKLSEEELRKKKLQEVLVKKSIEHSSILHNEHQVNGNGRIRIAQVPYAKSLALEKKKVLEQAKVETKTVAQTKKGARVAHIPQIVPQLIRPEPLQTPNCTQKFPLNVRQFYLNAMQDICVQIYTNSDDAAQRAMREEFACYERCKALNVYKNSCMLTVHRLRKEVDQKSNESSASYSGTVSHEAVLAGKVKGSWSVIKPKKTLTNFKGVSLYNMLSKWILTEQELRDNGFPRPHPDGPKGRAKLYVANVRGQSTISKVPNERYCCRCNKPFMVDKHGFPVRKENCIYHYARKFTFRGESKYMCCKQDGSADGCCDATTHVWDFVDLENLRGYVQTFDKDNASAEEQGIFALDCEMCYTTQGLELTRVTVINEDCQVVYETLVKPSHPIIDFNTRFSGISEGDMKTVTTSLLDVQATLLSMFSSKTILIGHSLESDFKALKLLHDTVVDTSVMFPHKNGPPYKRALKTLCSEYLRKIIQNELGGHDSKEDAVACMELVHWKVKEEAKLQ